MGFQELASTPTPLYPLLYSSTARCSFCQVAVRVFDSLDVVGRKSAANTQPRGEARRSAEGTATESVESCTVLIDGCADVSMHFTRRPKQGGFHRLLSWGVTATRALWCVFLSGICRVIEATPLAPSTIQQARGGVDRARRGNYCDFYDVPEIHYEIVGSASGKW